MLHRPAVLLVSSLLTIAQAQTPPEPWLAMDYGPFFSASIEVSNQPTNIAYKGIAIPLNYSTNTSPQPHANVLFDTDLLRYAAGWTDGFLNLKGVAFDGEHWAYPSIQGSLQFENPTRPGWSLDGEFSDPRPLPYGPIPHNLAHWKGLYLHKQQVILHYTVNSIPILESPSTEGSPTQPTFVRALEIPPHPQSLFLEIATSTQRQLQIFNPQSSPNSNTPQSIAALLPLSTTTPTTSAVPLPTPALQWPPTPGQPSPTELLLHQTSITTLPDSSKALLLNGESKATLASNVTPNFLQTDLTWSLRFKTKTDGTLIAETQPSGLWIPNGKSLFIRNGKLNFDVGWVGCITGSRTVTDDQWHHAALVWSKNNESITLFLDGSPDAQGELAPSAPLSGAALQIGYTNPNFPETTGFTGIISNLRIDTTQLSPEQIQTLAGPTSPQPASALFAAVTANSTNLSWLTSNPNTLALKLPPSTQTTLLKVFLQNLPDPSPTPLISLLKNTPPPQQLRPLTQGSPARWNNTLTTQGQLGPNTRPYAIDTLTAPDNNPWHSWLRFGGLDFFPNGTRAVTVTWNGDVWLVDGINDSLAELHWKRIATGLFQPLGVKVINNTIYVLGRDQITRLHDLNGDLETDFYENFNNDCMVSEHFHEFANDLKTDAEGNLYYIKCARHALPASHPHHGTLFKISPDGQQSEIVARGFRAVNGLGIGPNNEITCVDNQGHWMPANRINWVEPGGFYGNMWAWQDEPKRTNYDQPLCWVHNFVDRSGGTHLWVPDNRWGPLSNKLITLSYGMGHMFHVLHETVDGTRQGGLTRFPLEFDTGVMRGVFHPHDGQLYTAGLYGWAGNKTKPGGLYRIRYTGKPLHLPESLHVTSDGLVISFTDPLDPTSALDPGNYHLQAWNYRWSAQYGSPDLKLDGSEGRENWTITQAALSQDHKTVFLKIPDLQPVMQAHLEFTLQTPEQQPIENFIHFTIHKTAATPGLPQLGSNPLSANRQPTPATPTLSPGLVQHLLNPANGKTIDAIPRRNAALHLQPAEPTSPLAPHTELASHWEGFLSLDRNASVQIRAKSTMPLHLYINDELAISPNSTPTSTPLSLRQGPNKLLITYSDSPATTRQLQLHWSINDSPFEPIPPTALAHDPKATPTQHFEEIRQGRHLFTQLRCNQCHAQNLETSPLSMPELAAKAPDFTNLHERLNPSWTRNFILNPSQEIPHSRMPRLLHNSPQSEQQANDITAFLFELTTPPSPSPQGNPQHGESLYQTLGCFACHTLPADPPHQTTPPRLQLHHVTAKWQPAALARYLANPTEHYPWNPMPDFHLQASEAQDLAAYLIQETQTIKPPANNWKTGKANQGQQLLTSLGCLNCHTHPNLKTTTLPPPLKTLAETSLANGCLSTNTPNPNQPAYHLSTTETQALQSFLTALNSPLLPTPETLLTQDNAPEFAQRQFKELRCQACHARDHETDAWSTLETPNPNTSQDLDEEELALLNASAGSVHLGRPALTHAGNKLRASWMQRFISGTLDYKPRANDPAKMPGFAAQGYRLASGIAQEHGLPPTSQPLPQPNTQLVPIGQQLTLVGSGFGCVACHNVGNQKALAGTDTATINFHYITDRLLPEYYWQYLRNPQLLRPGTMMPSFINPDGTTPVTTTLQGNATKQFDAIWNYLLSLTPENIPTSSPPQRP